MSQSDLTPDQLAAIKIVQERIAAESAANATPSPPTAPSVGQPAGTPDPPKTTPVKGKVDSTLAEATAAIQKRHGSQMLHVAKVRQELIDAVHGAVASKFDGRPIPEGYVEGLVDRTLSSIRNGVTGGPDVEAIKKALPTGLTRQIHDALGDNTILIHSDQVAEGVTKLSAMTNAAAGKVLSGIKAEPTKLSDMLGVLESPKYFDSKLSPDRQQAFTDYLKDKGLLDTSAEGEPRVLAGVKALTHDKGLYSSDVEKIFKGTYKPKSALEVATSTKVAQTPEQVALSGIPEGYHEPIKRLFADQGQKLTARDAAAAHKQLMQMEGKSTVGQVLQERLQTQNAAKAAQQLTLSQAAEHLKMSIPDTEEFLRISTPAEINKAFIDANTGPVSRDIRVLGEDIFESITGKGDAAAATKAAPSMLVQGSARRVYTTAKGAPEPILDPRRALPAPTAANVLTPEDAAIARTFAPVKGLTGEAAAKRTATIADEFVNAGSDARVAATQADEAGIFRMFGSGAKAAEAAAPIAQKASFLMRAAPLAAELAGGYAVQKGLIDPLTEYVHQRMDIAEEGRQSKIAPSLAEQLSIAQMQNFVLPSQRAKEQALGIDRDAMARDAANAQIQQARQGAGLAPGDTLL